MYEDHTIAVVVPAYNEEGLVGTVIDTMAPEVDRLFVVDDRSTDGTWAEIQAHAADVNESRRGIVPAEDRCDAPFVVPIRKEQNGGRGSCIKLGYGRALREEFDVVVVMDGDGQMDPKVLPRLVDPIVAGEADYSKGDRMRSKSTREGMSSWRSFGNNVLGILTKISSGYWRISDSQNGYTAISREALEEIRIDDLYDGYGFLNDVLVTLNIHETRIANVAHKAKYGDEQSGIQYRSFVPLLSLLLLRCFFRRLRAHYLGGTPHPVPLCYGFGSLVFFGGLIGLLATLVGTVWTAGVPLFDVYSSVAMLAGGSFLFSLGAVFDFRHNEQLHYQGAGPIETASGSSNRA
jgi:glycosyltransferase involved in cell wall biosynthesis